MYWHAVSSLHLIYGCGSLSIQRRLAYCEIYVTVALIFSKFDDLEVHGVGPEALVYDDYFSGYHPETARDFRVRRLKSLRA